MRGQWSNSGCGFATLRSAVWPWEGVKVNVNDNSKHIGKQALIAAQSHR